MKLSRLDHDYQIFLMTYLGVNYLTICVSTQMHPKTTCHSVQYCDDGEQIKWNIFRRIYFLKKQNLLNISYNDYFLETFTQIYNRPEIPNLWAMRGLQLGHEICMPLTQMELFTGMHLPATCTKPFPLPPPPLAHKAGNVGELCHRL